MSPRPTIAFVTDFGHDSPYVAQMKCVARSINPAIDFLDVTHSIPPQDIQHASIVVDQIADFLNNETCLVAIVDPGVGSDRRILAAQFDGVFFVAPDNGTFGEYFHRKNVTQIVDVTESGFWRDVVSSTFHGRDIMTPVAAHLLSGIPINELGPGVESFHQLPIVKPKIDGKTIQGKILYADSFGNLITNISRKFLFDAIGSDTAPSVNVSVGSVSVGSIRETYSDVARGELVPLFGSNNMLEIAKADGNLLLDGRISEADAVVVRW